ncbi:MAG: hypothetical protein LBH04_02380 [Tannerellaceae bacterium]|jgi:hypothetical protein|nr:hypothetical protein [Tannerellaceae bacterium]
MKKLIFIFAVAIFTTEVIHAQWTKEDSTWLGNVLSGKEELRLNQETIKAIRSGTFLNLGEPIAKPLSYPIQLQIQSQFENIAAFDTTRFPNELNPDIMDPYLYFKYFFTFVKLPPLKEERKATGFDLSNISMEDAPLRPRDPRTVVTMAPSHMPGELNAYTITIRLWTGDAASIFAHVFSSVYRRRMYNMQHAKAWKIYNSERLDTIPPAINVDK